VIPNYYFGRTWKEAVVTYLKYICLEKLRRTTKLSVMIAGF